ncbi:hypothetical protein BCEN4_2120016 [Burkholderia cenocepacia]|nr:hypothetical protein BCEN4_2120016 [Burkholderia cenocepacia]
MPTSNTSAAGSEPDGRPRPDEAFDAVLAAELGDALVTRAADIDPRYFTAYNEPAGVRPRALVRPCSVDDVSRTLALCSRLGQPVVPQGGLTGLARGAARSCCRWSASRASKRSTRRPAQSPCARARRCRRCRKPPKRRASRSVWTLARAARARSAACSRPMRAARARSATG